MDPHAILGIEYGASHDDIKKAFRKLAHQHHPDKGSDGVKFKQITAAYAMLMKPRENVRPVMTQRKPSVVVHVTFNGGGGFSF